MTKTSTNYLICLMSKCHRRGGHGAAAATVSHIFLRTPQWLKLLKHCQNSQTLFLTYFKLLKAEV